MNRSVYVRILFFSIAVLLLFSCEDIFHNANSVLTVIDQSNKNSDDSTQPEKIYFGGYFSYNNGAARQAFGAVDGSGYFQEDFFSTEHIGIYSADSTTEGIHAIELTTDYIYVAGNFEGYDNGTQDTSYRMLQRYSYDGTLDTTYTPVSVGVTLGINALQFLNDGTLLVGGDFTAWSAYSYLVRLNSDGTTNSSIPLITGGSNVRSFYTPDDNSIIALSGLLFTINADSVYSNFAVINGSNWDIGAPEVISSPPADEVNAMEISNGNLFLGGSTGIFEKYIYNGSSYVLDADFNAQIIAELARTGGSLIEVHAIRADSQGRVYVGGSFSNLQDLNGAVHDFIIRLTESGYIDPSFNINPDGTVRAIEIQDNGSILLGGDFVNVDGNDGSKSANGIIRISNDGDIDHSFSAELPGIVNTSIYAIAIQEDE